MNPWAVAGITIASTLGYLAVGAALCILLVSTNYFGWGNEGGPRPTAEGGFFMILLWPACVAFGLSAAVIGAFAWVMMAIGEKPVLCLNRALVGAIRRFNPDFTDWKRH